MIPVPSEIISHKHGGLSALHKIVTGYQHCLPLNRQDHSLPLYKILPSLSATVLLILPLLLEPHHHLIEALKENFKGKL